MTPDGPCRRAHHQKRFSATNPAETPRPITKNLSYGDTTDMDRRGCHPDPTRLFPEPGTPETFFLPCSLLLYLPLPPRINHGTDKSEKCRGLRVAKVAACASAIPAMKVSRISTGRPDAFARQPVQPTDQPTVNQRPGLDSPDLHVQRIKDAPATATCAPSASTSSP